MDKINILGVNISSLDYKNTIEKIKGFLNDGKQHIIVTPNPEFLIVANKDEEFFYILNNADLAVPDGVGLVFASLFLGKKLRRITGVDLIYDICRMAEHDDLSIYLLGGSEGTAKLAGKKLKDIYPNLKIVGAEAGLVSGEWEIKEGEWVKGEEMNDKLLVKINEAKPDIIFVAFGHPRQEKWIYHSLKKIPSAKIAIGIGGGLDFISGRVRRAPVILRKLSIEWLWRLIIEPSRWKRIFDAVIIFPLKFIHWKFIMPFQYRSNVACLLYKKENGSYKIFIVERTGEPDHWQIPQGGTDGLSLADAGAKELREETGNSKFVIKKIIPKFFVYEFGEGNGKYKTKKHIGYKGQKQGLCIAEFTGTDDDIKIKFWDHSGWKWVESKKLADEVHAVRREATEKFLSEFNNYIDNLAKN